jgi:hypothetical protein
MARIRKAQKETVHIGTKALNQIIWRIAVYIRLSKEDANKEDGNSDNSESVINQKKILIEYLEKFFEGQYVIVDFYIDDGLTGTDDTRADFMRMIQDIEQGQVNCVLVKTLARAFRNYSDQGYYLEYYFPQKNVRFISTGDPAIDTFKNPDAITGLEVPISGLMNDRFACRTSNDVRRTFNTKRREGEFIGAFPPYGYLKNPEDKNHLILDDDIVPIKRDMKDWIINDGMSLNGVAQKLNELGIPNPTAYKRSKGWKYNNPNIKKNDGLWTGATVKRVLLDKVNLGHMVQGKQKVVSYKVHDRVTVPEDDWFIKENTHEPTFTQEEYDTLARILQRDTRTPNGERKVHLFSGFLRCADCDKALQRRSAKELVYYACRTYTEKSKEKCTKHSIRVDLLEKAVLAAIQAQIGLVDSLVEVVDEINEAPVVDTQSKRIEKMLGDKRRELEKARSVSDSLYVDWKSGEITREDYRRMKAKFEEQIEQLTSAIINLEEEQRRMNVGVNSENVIFTQFRKFRNVQQLDRSILIELVDTIYVHENKEITIQFRFADELARILEFVEQNRPEASYFFTASCG